MTVSVQDYKAMVGSELGVSRWFEVDQKRIDTFAECTEDFQFIHVDAERAADTPFGGTIAHGFLTLSLLSAMAYELFPKLEGAKMGVNYGMNKLRFLAPVRSGKRVRGRMKLLDVTERNPGVLQSTYEVVVEIEGEDKPALLAEWVGLAYV
ncbi:MaoC family dehydratase [Sphingosinicella microcystinivorans]|uniref:Acyl dehydratase n=1 Tax=Sphingosinicella microcystinivorans TaxID=335406 RepID=A0AAD1D6G1_SPHMI|nr:MaoC family dehydratase [Sphingosinicella microcystinivorans]RKS91762.1 acyl dehydratase [Sphingosinicella microcystinivorans]BBE34747.1 nodulation protein NodN [Sphingosinicella microcystinivorans]